MNYGRFRGAGLAMAAALMAIGATACDDDNVVNNKNDLSVTVDMSMKADAGADLAMETPSTAQITVADVVGDPFIPNADGGIPLSAVTHTQTHTLAVVVDFPKTAGTSQHTSGTDVLHGCTWDRYNNAAGPFPAPNENAGSVTVTGFDAVNTRAIDTTNPASFAAPAVVPDSTINCAFVDMTKHYECSYGTDATHSTDNYIFPITQVAPTPSPAFINADLIPGGTITENFTTTQGSTFTDSRTGNAIAGLDNTSTFTATIVAVNGVATAAPFTTLATTAKLDGSADVTIDYSCDGTATKGHGCPLAGGITGLLIQTSLDAPWKPANLLRFGTAQCVDQDGTAAAHSFTLPKEMIKDILGVNAPPGGTVETVTTQSIRIVLVRLKPAVTFSGTHPLYFTAGRGIFGFVNQ